MYLEHFALSAPPFQFTASPMALFMSRTHREAMAALEWGLIHEPSGLTLLLGESGTGKTTLVCALLARQVREVRAAYLGNPKLTFLELLGSTLSQLGVRGGRGSKGAMLNAFAQYALDLPLNEHIAILIDEAQALSDDALEEFRLLSNLERHGRKAAQIVLAGQYELARRLADPAMHHFNERIGARAVLLPLSTLECREYIEHRLRLSGSTSDRIFAHRAIELIVRQSAGVPRRINALCHNSLLLAYSAGAPRVTVAMAREAAADYALLVPATNNGQSFGWMLERLRSGVRSMRPVLGLGLLGAAGFVTGHLMMNHAAVAPVHSRAARAVSSRDGAAMPVAELHPKIERSAPVVHSAIEPTKAGADESLMKLDVAPSGASDPGSESSYVKAGLAAPLAPDPPASAPASAAEAAAAEPAAAPASAPGSESASDPERPFVVVARGDTLGGIALRHLGSISGVSNLMRLNPHISDAARVYPGELVYLPPSFTSSSKQTNGDSDVE